jgi:hypothetical protein
MPTSIDESPRRQQDPEHQPGQGFADDPRNSVQSAADNQTRPHTPHTEDTPHAGFDADLNPIDDDAINSRGSER